MVQIIQIKRRISGVAGAPASLKSGELAWNQVDDIVYAGFGDDGSGNATSIVPIGGRGYFASLAALGDAGGGDMLAAEYDTNDDGQVDAADTADAVPWSGVTGKPTEFPPENHDASKITTGQLDVARLPSAVFASPIVSTGGIADLDAGQQAQIRGGSTVTTTDGKRWQYSGAGDKTDPASYVEMADVTPDWTEIADKPTEFPPAAHTHTLADIGDAGSMAGQDADAVDITGGSIAGVTFADVVLDCGEF